SASLIMATICDSVNLLFLIVKLPSFVNGNSTQELLQFMGELQVNEVVEFNFVFDKHSLLCLRQFVLPALTMVQYQNDHSWIKGLLIN
ncbi:hypothetical protein, partial [Pseudoalteromonas rubra]|uniref:hypothetical protein n=1 Tax=Pseudoalteromonas rubra TaxID=43658 RepID=UPI002DB55C79